MEVNVGPWAQPTFDLLLKSNFILLKSLNPYIVCRWDGFASTKSTMFPVVLDRPLWLLVAKKVIEAAMVVAAAIPATRGDIMAAKPSDINVTHSTNMVAPNAFNPGENFPC